ncbi:hypothetical protein BC834DRAFT_6131 [Gloeopeniophorella convolvens]|nr:hypothetical protein BC834DRAFT_6131 [Gloeopeniophorella convolvens]
MASPNTPATASSRPGIDSLVNAMQNAALSPSADTDASPPETAQGHPAIHPFISYTQAQLLSLHKSPLVSLPKGMPTLKDWFGDWNEQNAAKKDADSSTTTSGTRDKRFRRDQEDAADNPPRATFRSQLSQPSQMGNFKHQSIRTSEREKDKDTERDRERDLRDKEGQERLRSLSDKYDRDRLSSPAGGAGLRARERDSAPHLVGGTSRLSSQGSLGSGTTRRADGRDSSRRKVGESSEDWRRGRDDRSDGLRREREDRERPRSRARDSSRQRRDPSPLRRDRDLDGGRDRDRDDHRRRDERRDDHVRRDRDIERDTDDARRWRDDGKRDERLAARRELRDKELRERERDRDRERGSRGNERDPNWDSDRARDRDRDRWNLDERDPRSRRANGRDRRGHSRDEDRDGRDRDERKDSRNRVEEKEPAWMDTYIPDSAGAGILGGKAENGELDGIQAWKLGMKEKERKERDSETSRILGDAEQAVSVRPNEAQAAPPADPPLDEIQLFKLMIKREEEKNKTGSPKVSSNDPAVAYISLGNDDPATQKPLVTLGSSESQSMSSLSPSPLAELPVPAVVPSTKPSTPSAESPKPSGSRFFPNPTSSENSSLHGLQDRQPAPSIKAPTPSLFNPPPGSRLLAFGSRTPSASTRTAAPSDQPSSFAVSTPTLDASPSFSSINGSRLGSEVDSVNSDPALRSSMNTNTGLPPPGFHSVGNSTRQPVFHNDGNSHAQPEVLRRQSLASFGDRSAFGASSESISPYSELGSSNQLLAQSTIPSSQSPSFDSGGRERGPGGSPFPQQKGSRFAKFFDGKSREQLASSSADGLENLVHPALVSYQRQQNMGGEGYALGPENRTMEDIFAMLQNSTQAQRLVQASPQAQSSGYGQVPFVQQGVSSGRQPPVTSLARNHDILYDNRLDDRFVPDGMVPGLRPTFPPRRESVGMFQEQLDDLNAFNVQQRIPPQRAMEQMFHAPPPSVYPNQPTVPRNPGLPIQQPFRNGGSPSNPTHLHGPPQQRLPPGLANLGGRPPHDPSQFLGSITGVSSSGPQGGGSGLPYNFPGGIGYSTAPVRGPPGPHIQSAIDAGTLLHASKLDARGPAQSQLVGLNNGASAAGLRGPGVGFQQNAMPMHMSHAAMRQPHMHQQSHPQAMSHLLPQHMQANPTGGSQPAQDLMALLMHGVPRD